MSYAHAQLAAALSTAVAHPDAATRERAGTRAQRWASHLRAVGAGQVAVGARRPTAWPAWVTLEVLRGGFATGDAVAAGPLAADEMALAADLGLDGPVDRARLFAALLTPDGLAWMEALLDSGGYALDCPEESVALVVAWLVRAGDVEGAVALVTQVAPYSDRLRLWPRRAAVVAQGAGLVHRSTVADARAALRARRPNPRVEAQREALTVWAPFADRLLALWWETAVDGRVGTAVPAGFAGAAARAVADYDRLRVEHTRCTRHANPKENLAILVEATRHAASGATLTVSQVHRLRLAADAMIARRGHPGSLGLAAARGRQVGALTPSHAAVAQVVAGRLAGLASRGGVADPAPFLAPVAAPESSTDVPEGTPVPPSARRIVGRARAGTLDDLVVSGVVPSADVLAAVVPQVVAPYWAGRYADAALVTLMGRVYEAFRARRSLLLVNLASQVRIGELPWVRALDGHARAEGGAAEAGALREVARVHLDRFAGQVLPNPLVAELSTLAKRSGQDDYFLPELAADIFTGEFSPRFPRAGLAAARMLSGTAYDAYYGLAGAMESVTGSAGGQRAPGRPSGGRAVEAAFAAVCRERAGVAHRDAGGPGGGWSVVANGAVIEQAQILTTHGLVGLVACGAQPSRGWQECALDAFDTAREQLTAAGVHRRTAMTDRAAGHASLLEVKNAAFAWRQTVFFVSMLSGAAGVDVLAEMHARAGGAEATGRGVPREVARWSASRAADLVADLRGALGGVAPQRPFLGWALGPHPVFGQRA